MKPSRRAFHWDDDVDALQDFLRITYGISQSFQNWIPSMILNLRYGPCGTPYQEEEDEYVKIWEVENAGIIAITICKPSGECQILIHPEYRSHEELLIESLETQARTMQSGRSQKSVHFLVQSGDRLREGLLKERGYENRGLFSHNRILPTDFVVPEVILPEGYSVRHVDPEKDFEWYREVQSAVFSHCASMTQELLRMYTSASFYDPYRDVVVVAPDGGFAAFATGRIDMTSRLAEIEPVGVHPDHRKKGLGKAIVFEAIRRLQQHGAAQIVILGAASSEAATRLYDSIGFERSDVNLWSCPLQ